MAGHVQEMEAYYAVYLIEIVVEIELVARSRRSLQQQLLPITIAFFLGFMYIVAQIIVQMLAQRGVV